MGDEVEDAVLGSSKTAVEEETSEDTKAGEEVDDEAIKANTYKLRNRAITPSRSGTAGSPLFWVPTAS